MTGINIMNECDLVREALLSGCFDALSREDVNRHLLSHDECGAWASRTLLLTHLLASGDSPQPAPSQFDESVWEEYLAGTLSQADRRNLEDACCRDLELARQMSARKRRRVLGDLGKVSVPALGELLASVKPYSRRSLTAGLEHISSLYLHKPLAMAAAHTQLSTFQTPDGSLVVSVVDKGAPRPDAPHLIEIGVLVHDDSLIGRWACYQIRDAAGELAAAGLFHIQAHGDTIRLTIPPTERVPYTVGIEALEIDTSQLQELIRKFASSGDSPPEISQM